MAALLKAALRAEAEAPRAVPWLIHVKVCRTGLLFAFGNSVTPGPLCNTTVLCFVALLNSVLC